ncbi:MAG: PEP-CTERM sorting domain-containing protein [Verrucomicrobiota bacterium]
MPRDHRSRLIPDDKLSSLSLAALAAAGVSLPEKAEAVIIVNNDVLTDPAATAQINLQFNPTGTNSGIQLSAGINPSAPGWIFDLRTQTVPGYTDIFYAAYFEFATGTIIASVTYQFLGFTFSYYFPPASSTYIFTQITLFSDTQAFLLSAVPSPYTWLNNGLLRNPLPVNSNPFYIGLRRIEADGDAFYGWAKLQYGSITHLQSAFNSTSNGNITIGQVPEPSTALLLAAGSASLLATRKRRKKAA